MNRSENIFLVLCAALLLAADLGCAETAIWSENFDTAGASSRWTVAGAWQIGTPTKGPSAHSGTKCASTQNYSYNQDGRLVCINYNGASTLVVPSADQFPRLRFWHWFNLANALGYVEISTNSGGSWIQISPTYIYSGTATSGGVWSRPYIDLSGFAGQSVQIGFHFTSGGCCGNSLGWYVDDVAVVTGQPVFNNPEGFESGPQTNDWSVDMGTWQIGKPTSGPNAAHGGANCAATILAGNYTNNVNSRLISPPFLVPASSNATLRFWQWYSFNNALGFVEVNNGFIATTSITNTTITTNIVPTGLNTNIYQLYGAANSYYSTPFYWNQANGCWTNATKALGTVLDSYYANYWFDAGTAPLSSVGVNPDYRAETVKPSPQSAAATNFLAWQGMTWNSATSGTDNPIGYFGTNYNYTYTTNTTYVVGQSSWTQVSPTYQNGNTGSKWENVSLDMSAYAGQTVQVAFHFVSGGIYTAPGWYVDDISLVAPPTLNVPPTQTIYYSGQPLDVTISANSFFPNDTLTFALVSPYPAGVNLDPNTGELTWSPATNQVPSTNTITVEVTDNVLLLSATNSFVVQVLEPLVFLTAPPKQTNYANVKLDVTLSATNYANPDDPLTFETDSPTPANVLVDPNTGELTWTPTAAQAGSNTITVTVTDANDASLSATTNFVVVVSTNYPPPTLNVPPKQTIFAGQTLDVTISATNSFFPTNALTFTLVTNNPPIKPPVIVNPINGVLTWATAINQPPGTNTIIVKVSDSVLLLSATTNFVVVVKTNPPAPALLVPPTQTIYAGQTLTVTNYGYYANYTNNVLLGSSAFTYSLLSTSPAGVVLVTTNGVGVLTWATTTAQTAGTYTNVIKVVDCLTGFSATNKFLVQVLPPQPPTLIVPLTQTIYAYQTMVVTNQATNVYAGDTFTFAAFGLNAFGLAITNLDVSNLPKNGVLKWTPTVAQAPSTNTIYVQVTDNNSLSTISNFLVVVLPPQPPTLIVPPTQIIYPGQTLIVTNHATSIYSNNTFIFALLSGPANMDISKLTNDGVLKWTPTAAQAPSANTIYVMVTDNNSLSATNNFLVLVPTPPPPGFTVSPRQTLTINGFQFTLNTTPDTTWQIDASTNLLNWQSIGTYTANPSGTIQCTDLLATNFLQRFYRAVWQ